MAEDQRESAWADLPPELLDLVLYRLPSHADRVRAVAVCRRWSSVDSLRPPPMLPWLAFGDGTLFDLANDSAPHPHYRVQGLPSDAFCYSAGGNMFFLLHPDGSCSLVNALSGATTPLPELAANLRVFKADESHLRAYKVDRGDELKDRIRKVVVMPSASEPDHPIVAVLVRNHGCELFVSTCRPAGEINSCLVAWNAHDVVDIAPFQGKIFVLSLRQGLIALEVSSRHLRKPVPPRPGIVPKSRSGVELIKDSHSPQQQHQDREDLRRGCELELHLVESSGKLLMVRQWVKRDCWITCDFEVSEADLKEGRWKEFDGDLDGRALFVSKPCSKSLPAGHGVREDCIYFLNKLNTWKEPAAPLGDSGVYSIRDEEFTPLLPESAPLMPWENWRFPAWFFPVKV